LSFIFHFFFLQFFPVSLFYRLLNMFIRVLSFPKAATFSCFEMKLTLKTRCILKQLLLNLEVVCLALSVLHLVGGNSIISLISDYSDRGF
jgi:hypothetical protein